LAPSFRLSGTFVPRSFEAGDGMTAVVVNAAQLQADIPALESLAAALEANARAVAGIDVPAGVPGALAARVRHTTHTVSAALQRGAHAVDPLAGQVRRRVVIARYAESPGLAAAGWTLPMFTNFAKSFSAQSLGRSAAAGMAARDIFAGLRQGQRYGAGTWPAFRVSQAAARAATAGAHGVPAGLAAAGRYGARGMTAVNWGVTLATNLRNPNLSTGQKIGRTAASIATGTGVSIAASAASGAAFGAAAGPVGALVGLGAGTAWAIADKKFHVSDTIGDAAADAGSAVGHAADDAADAVGNAASDAAGAAKSVGKKALGVIGL
jgi:hypothetical protein